jgi:acyl-coenzyme A thioesterase PaaI-like protein
MSIEMKTNYLKPFKEREITAVVKIIHRGSGTALCEVEVEVTNEKDVMIAKALTTYMIMKKKQRIYYSVYYFHKDILFSG